MRKFYYGCHFTRNNFSRLEKKNISNEEAGKQVSAQQRENKLKADWNEMTNSPKGNDTGPGLQDIATMQDDYIGDRPNQTSYANDAPVIGRYLLRLGFSVDQEDRFLAAQENSKYQDLAEARKWLRPANDRKLKRAVESICSVSQREDRPSGV
jgi:hypothetical protein